MNEHAGHRSRLRENFIQNGIEGMADHQVLELNCPKLCVPGVSASISSLVVIYCHPLRKASFSVASSSFAPQIRSMPERICSNEICFANERSTQWLE